MRGCERTVSDRSEQPSASSALHYADEADCWSPRLARPSIVDTRQRCADNMCVLKARLSFLLLLGALLGLFGQGAAYAIGPAFAPAMEASHAMASGMDCAEMGSDHKSKPNQPCKGLTLACIAQMGCVVPMTLETPSALTERAPFPQLAAIWSAAPTLAGLTIPPEPEPPTV